MKWALVTAVLGCLLFTPANHGASEKNDFHEDFEQGLDARWKKVEFEGTTRYTVEKEETNSVLKAMARSSASGLAVELAPLDPKGATLSWRWKIDKIPAGGSDDKKSTFDHTARLFVAFKTFIGPPRTINYVWANEVPVGKTFHHPSSGRSRFVVLKSGNDAAGKWHLERRNLAEDWKRLFGNDDPPDIVGIGFMTDSDGTKTTVTGWYDDIELRTVK